MNSVSMTAATRSGTFWSCTNGDQRKRDGYSGKVICRKVTYILSLGEFMKALNVKIDEMVIMALESPEAIVLRATVENNQDLIKMLDERDTVLNDALWEELWEKAGKPDTKDHPFMPILTRGDWSFSSHGTRASRAIGFILLSYSGAEPLSVLV